MFLPRSPRLRTAACHIGSPVEPISGPFATFKKVTNDFVMPTPEAEPDTQVNVAVSMKKKTRIQFSEAVEISPLLTRGKSSRGSRLSRIPPA